MLNFLIRINISVTIFKSIITTIITTIVVDGVAVFCDFIIYPLFLVFKLLFESTFLLGLIIYSLLLSNMRRKSINLYVNRIQYIFDYWSWVVGVDINVSRWLVTFAIWFKVVLIKSKLMSMEFTILRSDDISVLNPSKLKALIIFLCILKF